MKDEEAVIELPFKIGSSSGYESGQASLHNSKRSHLISRPCIKATGPEQDLTAVAGAQNLLPQHHSLDKLEANTIAIRFTLWQFATLLFMLVISGIAYSYATTSQIVFCLAFACVTADTNNDRTT